MDDDDELLLGAGIAAAVVSVIATRTIAARKRKRRSVWVRQLFQRRSEYGAYSLLIISIITRSFPCPSGSHQPSSNRLAPPERPTTSNLAPYHRVWPATDQPWPQLGVASRTISFQMAFSCGDGYAHCWACHLMMMMMFYVTFAYTWLLHSVWWWWINGQCAAIIFVVCYIIKLLIYWSYFHVHTHTQSCRDLDGSPVVSAEASHQKMLNSSIVYWQTDLCPWMWECMTLNGIATSHTHPIR